MITCFEPETRITDYEDSVLQKTFRGKDIIYVIWPIPPAIHIECRNGLMPLCLVEKTMICTVQSNVAQLGNYI